jgi:hypothetical protein
MSQGDQRRLAPGGTFVVQLRAGSDVTQRQLSGRVEHVVSGESEPFASLDALLAFMARFTDSGAEHSN